MSEPEEGVRKTEPDLPAADGPAADGPSSEGPVRKTEPDLPSEPVRQTQPDLDPAAAPEEEFPSAHFPEVEPERPKTKPKSWVYFLVGGLLFASVAGPLAFYFLVWRYKPTAVQHIPIGTTVAVRFDGRELYLDERFRQQVLSPLEDAEGVNSYAERIKSRTGIDLRSDVRELIFATTNGKSFVVLLGGRLGKTRLEQDRFPAGLYSVLTEKGAPGFSMDGDVLVGPGLRVAQSKDDTVIIGSDAGIIDDAMDPSETYKNLGLASSEAMSFVIDAPALSTLARTTPGSAGTALGKMDRVSGYFRLGKSKLFIDVVPQRGIGSEALGKDLEDALVEMRALSLLLPDTFGEKAALGAARVKPRPETVMIETDWPREGVEKAFTKAGEALKLVLSGQPPST